MTTDIEAGADDGFAGEAVERPAGQVPLAALQAERGRRQAAERERDDLLARLEPAEQAASAEAGMGGEADEAPWGHGELASLNEHLNASEAVARQSYGDAAVDAAEAWAGAAMRRDPALAAEILSHPDPYAFALGYAFSAGGGARAANAAPPAPPRSLTSAPSAGGAAHVPVGPGQAYDALFGS